MEIYLIPLAEHSPGSKWIARFKNSPFASRSSMDETTARTAYPLMISRFPLRSWVEIDADAFRHNLNVAQTRRAAEAALASPVATAAAGNPFPSPAEPGTVAVAGVVKGNAYGHGIDLAVSALAGKVDFFAVANLAEAALVHKNCEQLVNNRGISSQKPWRERILLLGPTLPDERPWIVKERFTPIVSTLEEARAYAALVRREPGKERFAVHLAVDTGMGRIGVWHEEALPVALAIREMPELELEGVATHLPSADEDREGTLEELALWRAFLLRLKENGISPRFCHAYNSAGTIGYGTETADNGNLVRPGLMLYGISPLPGFQSLLRPVLTWKTRLTLIRDLPAGRSLSYGRTFVTPRPMRVATLGSGYADGYFRQLSGTGAEVLIGGKRCPLLGRVTMDQMLVDISKAPDAAAGDEAVLIGRQGDAEILASELAEKAGTIPWHVFTAITARVERVAK